jgi:hypothetical protein
MGNGHSKDSNEENKPIPLPIFMPKEPLVAPAPRPLPQPSHSRHSDN